jgi:hypothetical protein
VGGRGAPLSHLGEKVEERGGQHAVRLLHDVVKGGRDPVQNGSGNDLKKAITTSLKKRNQSANNAFFSDLEHKIKALYPKPRVRSESEILGLVKSGSRINLLRKWTRHTFYTGEFFTLKLEVIIFSCWCIQQPQSRMTYFYNYVPVYRL